MTAWAMIPAESHSGEITMRSTFAAFSAMSSTGYLLKTADPQKNEVIDLLRRSAGTLRHPAPAPLQQRKEGFLSSWEAFRMSHERSLAALSRHALVALHQCVEINPHKLGGVPVLRGTRFSVAQLFAELADSDSVREIARDFDIKVKVLRSFLHAFAVYLDKPAVWTRR